MFISNKTIKYSFILAFLIAVGFYSYQSIAGAWKVNKSAVNNLTSGLVVYYSMDAADTNWTNNTVTDRSPGGTNTGTLTNMSTSTSPTSGRVGQALNFDGADDYVNATDIDITDQITVSAWINLRSDGFYAPIVEKTYSTAWYFGTRNNTTNPRALSVFINNGERAYTTDNAFNFNEWVYAAFTYNKDASGNDEVKIYVNGALVGTGDYSTAIGTNNNNITIGQNVASTYANGKIDEVRIYNRALSASEITELYQQGQTKINASEVNKLTNGLVGYWTFNGTDISGSTAIDKSPAGGNNGTINGTSRALGKIGQALTFGQNTDYVETTDSGSSTLDLDSAITISAWIKLDSLASLARGRIVGKPGVFFLEIDDNWNCDGDDQNAEFRMQFGSYSDACSNNNLISQINRWYHVVATYSSGTFSFFVDGSPVGTRSNTPTGYTNDNGVVIGKISSSNNNANFPGQIDEVRIYNRALSQSEITELYQQGQVKINASQTNKLTSGLVVYWPMDGNYVDWSQTSAEIRDVSGNGYHGDAINAGGSNVNKDSVRIGKIGQAIFLDQARDYISAGDIDALDGQQYLTISSWVNIVATRAYGVIVEKFWSPTNLISMGMSTDGYPSFRVELYLGDAVGSTSGLNLNNETNAWHLWTMVFDGTQASNATRLKFYYDGLQQALDFDTYPSTVPAATPADNYGSLVVGNNIGNPSPNSIVDEVRVYNRALSAGEVRDLYIQGK